MLLALSTGCTATCVRDSDCIGNSICVDDRCILVVRGDAGRAAPSQGGSNTAGSGSAGQAGNTQGGVGGASTDPRLNLDAAADADSASGSP
jgi:hypothetical protein